MYPAAPADKQPGLGRLINFSIMGVPPTGRPSPDGRPFVRRGHTGPTGRIPESTARYMFQLIRASAGSGKTFQLSGHFLQQLFLGHAPETILATTFTRKAAGEILGRVLSRLAASVVDADECQRLAEFLHPAVVTQERAEQLLTEVTKQLHRLRVSTLDSFFQQVARSLTLELGLPPGWSIIDEHVAAELRQQAIDAVLAQQVSKDSRRLMEMLARGRSRRSVRDLINDAVASFHELYLLAEPDAWQQIPRPQRLTRAQVTEALGGLRAILPTGKKSLDKAIASDLDRFLREDWEDIVGKGIAGKVAAGETSFSRQELPEELLAVYQPLVAHARAELLHVLANQTSATFDLIHRFDTEYRRLLHEHGSLNFNDVTRVLSRAEAQADGKRIDFRLDSRLHHLLLDEFQDTSPDQWNVLKRLAIRLSANPDESSFFCVGDPKQAIYGWRGGLAEILDVVENSVPHITPRSLNESRRSSKAVIDSVNRIFQHLKNHSNLSDYQDACWDWQDRFPTHTTVHNDQPGYVAFRSSPGMEGETSAERKAEYNRWVAEYIRELHRETPGAVIGVLTRKNSAVAQLVHQLTLLGVPASEEGGTTPTDSAAALAVFAVFHFVAHPGCQISRFHLMQSPFGPVLGLTSYNNDRQAAACAATFRRRLMDNGYGPTLQWLSDSVKHHYNQRDELRMQQIVAEGWQYDASASLNPADFVTMLESRRLSKSDAAVVRVMTIHQSKGLEFDIVVLPELDQRLFRTPAAAAASPSPAAPPDRVSIWRNKGIRDLLPRNLREAFAQTTRKDVSEALCLLYVALTRAESSLHLLTQPISATKLPSTFAGVLIAGLVDMDDVVADKLMFSDGDEQWFQSRPDLLKTSSATTELSESAKPLAIPLKPMTGRQRGLRRDAPSRHEGGRIRFPVTQFSTGLHDVSSDGQSKTTSMISPADRGTVIHEWFEQIEWLDENHPEDDVLIAIADAHFVSREDTESLLSEFRQMLESSVVQQALNKTQYSSNVESFTSSGHVFGPDDFKVINERPFVLKTADSIVQGTIDRLVLGYHAGKPVSADVIDFKTDRLHGDQTEWIASKANDYRDQLLCYQQAIHNCFGVPRQQITTRLLLLETDTLIDPLRQNP